MWRSAQKQMELEQTETFDYKGNTGFEKRVKIHSSEFHEMQMEVGGRVVGIGSISIFRELIKMEFGIEPIDTFNV